MLRALYAAASGMVAQQTNIETIANNLANVNTTGFKRGRAEFQDLFYAEVRPAVAGQAGAILTGQGTRLSGIHRIFAGGSMQVTGNTYDLAIQGPGFFRVQQADGTQAYTRDGALHVDGQGRLTTGSGELVLGDIGPITLPANAEDPEVAADGTVRYTAVDPATQKKVSQVAGRISLAIFANPEALAPLGSNLWAANAASGLPQVPAAGAATVGRVVQGYLEASNVQTVDEMVNLIVAQRAYEINSKVAQSADEMLGMANNIRRG